MSRRLFRTEMARERGAVVGQHHQLRATERVITDMINDGPGQRFLIQHSAGSGKTKTIAWLAHRLSSLLMITVTAIVYQVLLAPTIDVEGWSLLTDPILHVVTPLVTVVVWAVWGPRGWISARLVPLALVVPLAWIAWMMLRGAVVDAYPYGFANVTDLGYASVSLTLVMILVFGLVVAAAYWGVDVLLRRRSAQNS